MTPAEIEREFWRLCAVVDDLDRSHTCDVPGLEPHLLAILSFVKAHPEHEAVFVDLFCQIGARKDHLSPWILHFCMRELRYPQVQDAVNEHFGKLGGVNGAPRLMNFVSDVNWVYSDAPWEDAMFFEYYWNKEHPGEDWPCRK